MAIRKALLALALVSLLAGCGGEPVPPDKIAFVGEWKAPGMQLLLLQDGSVRYKRVKGGGSSSVTGPIQSFEGDNFVVGIGLWRTTFVVSKPPYQEGKTWKMVVDGVELTRSN